MNNPTTFSDISQITCYDELVQYTVVNGDVLEHSSIRAGDIDYWITVNWHWIKDLVYIINYDVGTFVEFGFLETSWVCSPDDDYYEYVVALIE